MRITKYGVGTWGVRCCSGHDEWPSEANYIVESDTGFFLEMAAFSLYDKQNKELAVFGEYPHTRGFTKEHAERIAEILNTEYEGE